MVWKFNIRKSGFPARASTRTWMFLTFAVFVGIAAGGAAFYVTLDFSNQIQEASRRSHLVDTGHLASIILSTELASTSPDEWKNVISPATATLLTFDDLHIFIGRKDSLHWRNDPLEGLSSQDLMAQTQPGQPFFDILVTENGKWFKIGAIRRDDSVIGLVRPVSALYILAANMRDKMIVGIGIALFMSMLGAWIASHEVTKPLRAIMQATRRIIGGEYDTPIRVTSRAAEFQDLGYNLEYMSRIYTGKIQELEDVTRLQTEFISNVSHEVRNPIFAISGFLEALGSNDLSVEHRKRYTAKGLTNLKRLSNLFGNLIEIARLENRDHPLNYSQFDLATLALDVKEILMSQAQKKDLQLEFDEVEAWVYADEDQIRRVLLNLVDNAIRYSDSGAIHCHFHKRLEKVRIEVIDDGNGIPEDHLNLIFERFYRVDRSRARQDGGSGLGLSIVKQILQEHGESIHVESIVGRGSHFWFELPQASEVSQN